ncbi:MAG: hypothetical protein RL173_1498 [Fibrobacterota bacterium]
MSWKNPVQLLFGLFETPPAPLRTLPKPTVSIPAPVPSRSPVPAQEHDGWRGLSDEVVFEFPPRLRKTWRLIRRRGIWVCQLPKVFVNAPLGVKQDLLAWLRAVLHPSPGSRAKKKQAQTRIFLWMAPHNPDTLPSAQTRQSHWNLDELFQKLNREYFDDALIAVVRWSPQIGGLSTHRKLQTASGSHHLLTISRGYDGPEVPLEAVEGVLYHEMCHIAFPPKVGTGSRRHVHHKEFRAAERRYRHFEAWRAWEAKHLHKQLRILRKSAAK